MPIYAYKALSEEGKKITGVIDADSLYLAKERLKKRQILLTEVSLFTAKKQELSLSPAMLLIFTREITQKALIRSIFLWLKQQSRAGTWLRPLPILRYLFLVSRN